MANFGGTEVDWSRWYKMFVCNYFSVACLVVVMFLLLYACGLPIRFLRATTESDCFFFARRNIVFRDDNNDNNNNQNDDEGLFNELVAVYQGYSGGDVGVAGLLGIAVGTLCDFGSEVAMFVVWESDGHWKKLRNGTANGADCCTNEICGCDRDHHIYIRKVVGFRCGNICVLCVRWEGFVFLKSIYVYEYVWETWYYNVHMCILYMLVWVV